MFLPVKRVVELNTKVFCFLDYFELIVANFQIQIFISTFEDIVLLLAGNKHGICFCNISGEFVALKPNVQLFETVINGLVQFIYIRRLVAQTCVINIHGNG